MIEIDQPSPAPEPFVCRFTLMQDGIIACQTSENNPLPGPAVARLAAGPHWSLPTFELMPDTMTAVPMQPAEIEVRLAVWLPAHIAETLPFLQRDEAAPEILTDFLNGVAEQGGIAERAALPMPELTPELRQYLRGKGMRLGPVHIYYQNLLKPAPLMLRALLWATHRGLPHPLPYPRAGVTSYTWPAEMTPNAELQHWFGYPLIARRACRVDRIDKIVCDVYDSAAKGVFTVKNAWAEWLGCKVEEVCDILAELGHVRVSERPTEEQIALDPELAKAPITFRLKSDRPMGERKERPARPPREKREARGDGPRKGRDEAQGDNVKPFRKKDAKSGKKFDQQKKPRFDKEAPLMASPFAGLKDMMGQ